MGERRTLGDMGDLGALDGINDRKPQRDRAWEAKQRDGGIVVTYRGIPRDLQARLKEIASEHGVRVGDVARKFLEHGIADYEAGTLKLEAHVRPDRTLYPDG